MLKIKNAMVAGLASVMLLFTLNAAAQLADKKALTLEAAKKIATGGRGRGEEK